MKNFNFINPTKENLIPNLYIGVLLVAISFFDVFLNSFFKVNLISFLPFIFSFFLPFIFGMIGLHLIRIEYSGIKKLDNLNRTLKNIRGYL